jgi:hypothetical protein
MSQKTFINQPGLTVALRTGSEGPRHDPYHYEEWTIRRSGYRGLTYHTGLTSWVKYRNGKIWTHCDGDRELLDVTFRTHTGFTFAEWRDIVAAVERHRYRRHRRHDVRQERGYPGEHFTICHTCGGEVIDSYFNEGAVI